MSTFKIKHTPTGLFIRYRTIDSSFVDYLIKSNKSEEFIVKYIHDNYLSKRGRVWTGIGYVKNSYNYLKSFPNLDRYLMKDCVITQVYDE